MARTDSPARAGAVGLLERDAELDAVEAALDAAAAGRGSLIVVEGPAGLGKSSLLAAAEGMADVRGMATLAATGAELERELPFGVARQLLEPPVEALSASERSRLLAGWAAPAATVLSHGAQPEAEGARALVHAMSRVFTQLAELRGPLLALVDDAQLADDASLRLLIYLGARLAPFPATVVAALRTGEPNTPRQLIDALRAASSAAPLRPAPLSPHAVGELVRRSYDGAAEDAFCDACGRVTGGNPFLLGELLTTLRADTVPATDAAAARLEGLVPDSVLLSTITRLGRMGEAAGRLATAVAVYGDGAPLRHAAALAELDPVDAEGAADALAAAEILAAGEPLAFAHPLIAAAVRADTPAFAAGRLHRRAAELLAGDGAPPDRVAAHLLESCPSANAWTVEVLRTAADRVLERGEPEAAIRLLERALREPPPPGARTDVAIELARAEAAAGRASAVQRLFEALELVEDARQRARVLHDLSRLVLLRSDLSSAAALAEQGLAELGLGTDSFDVAEPEPEDPLARKLLACSMAACSLDPALAERMRPRARAMSAAALDGSGPEDPEVQAQVAIVAAIEGQDRSLVRTLAEQSLAGHPLVDEGAAHSAFAFAMGALVYIDELEVAGRSAERALEHAERHGAVVAASFAHHWRAMVLLATGRPAESAEQAERALEVRRLGWAMTTEQTGSVLARALTELGELERARAAIDVAQPTERAPLVTVVEARGLLRLAEGDAKAALADLRETGELYVEQYGVRSPGVSSWRSHAALAALRLGRVEEAREMAEADLELARQSGVPRAVGVALRVNGLVDGGSRGLDLMRKGVAVFEGSPARLELARSLAELGAALRRDGQRSAAREPLRRALELADSAGAPRSPRASARSCASPARDRAAGRCRASRP